MVSVIKLSHSFFYTIVVCVLEMQSKLQLPSQVFTSGQVASLYLHCALLWLAKLEADFYLLQKHSKLF